MRVVLLALILWALMVCLGAWWVTAVTADEPPPAPAPDPIADLVDKWAHDWERGRA